MLAEAIMLSSANETLKQVLTHIFENWAMMFSEDADDIFVINHEEGLYHAAIGFIGPHRGTLELWVSSNLSNSLVANILGMVDFEDVQEVDKQDVVKELANVTCGHFLSTYYGPDDEFRLGMPVLEPAVVAPPRLHERINLNVDGIQIVADVTLDK
jgi:hypothetical protein